MSLAARTMLFLAVFFLAAAAHAQTPSTDAYLSSISFGPPGDGVHTFHGRETTTIYHLLHPQRDRVTINAHARDDNATTGFRLGDSTLYLSGSSQAVTNLVANQPRTAHIRVTAEDRFTRRDYTVHFARKSPFPTKGPDALTTFNVTVADWETEVAGAYGDLYGGMTHARFRVPGATRTARIYGVLSVDSAGFGSFSADTLAVCFHQAHTIPSADLLARLRLDLDDAEFEFDDATAFRNDGHHCWSWTRPAMGYDWSFAEKKSVKLFVTGNRPATGDLGLTITDPVGTVRTTARYQDTLTADVSGLSDPDGLTFADADAGPYAYRYKLDPHRRQQPPQHRGRQQQHVPDSAGRPRQETAGPRQLQGRRPRRRSRPQPHRPCRPRDHPTPAAGADARRRNRPLAGHAHAVRLHRGLPWLRASHRHGHLHLPDRRQTLGPRLHPQRRRLRNQHPRHPHRGRRGQPYPPRRRRRRHGHPPGGRPDNRQRAPVNQTGRHHRRLRDRPRLDLAQPRRLPHRRHGRQRRPAAPRPRRQRRKGPRPRAQRTAACTTASTSRPATAWT